MAVVYSLETGGVIWYVGSTVDAKRRERQHRKKTGKGIGASLIPNEYEWNFKVLEECPKEQMRERERFWYERLNPFYNKRIPNRSRTEANRETNRKWREANPEAARERSRKWQKANPERQREASRRWREANPEANREWMRRYRARQKQLKESSNTAIE